MRDLGAVIPETGPLCFSSRLQASSTSFVVAFHRGRKKPKYRVERGYEEEGERERKVFPVNCRR